MCRVTASILHKQSRTADKWFSPSFGVSRGGNIPHRTKQTCYEMLHMASELADHCEHSSEPEPSCSIKGREFG